MKALKDWKFWAVIGFCVVLAVGGIWYSTTHPDQVKPPAPISDKAGPTE